ncbi:MAG: hypothetical protein MJE63_05395 [Proteobacteria bacterium]|nr:hypothetical protein [Pseudomonadota bacterium]
MIKLKLKAFLVLNILLMALPYAKAEEPVLKCYPKSIKTGDAFFIEMKIPHGKDLIIADSKHRTSFLCWANMTVKKHKNPPMFKRSKCANISKVKIIAGETKAGGWNFDEEDFGPFFGEIFKSSGEYRVVLGQNLETDRFKDHRCKVYYQKINK